VDAAAIDALAQFAAPGGCRPGHVVAQGLGGVQVGEADAGIAAHDQPAQAVAGVELAHLGSERGSRLAGPRLGAAGAAFEVGQAPPPGVLLGQVAAGSREVDGRALGFHGADHAGAGVAHRRSLRERSALLTCSIRRRSALRKAYHVASTIGHQQDISAMANPTRTASRASGRAASQPHAPSMAVTAMVRPRRG
jgi:hypothetical protein